MVEITPQANRIHIGFFGSTNAGKSTLINLLAGQSVSLVSDVAGTTTDPVSKSMEILPLGPVVIIDTAGIDDKTELGQLRIAKTREVIPKVNLGVYVLRSDRDPSPEDMAWLKILETAKLPTALIINEIAGGLSGQEYLQKHPNLTGLVTALGYDDFSQGHKRLELLDLLGGLKPVGAETGRSLLDGLVKENQTIVLVCPIDSAAPKGRLILPQVQMLRNILDCHAMAHVVQVEQLDPLIKALKDKPDLVITDPQAFDQVNTILPEDIPLTSFSILMARFKGRLKDLIAGVDAVKHLKPGSRVLISEGCTHRRQCDDIGTVKIPMWLKKNGYEGLQLEWTSGGAFPQDLSKYDLIVHCGACMLTRREVLRRLDVSIVQGVPMVNYGVLIASLHGILERAISPFENELGN